MVRGSEQEHGDAVIVRRAYERPHRFSVGGSTRRQTDRLLGIGFGARAQVPQHTGEVVVAAEREHIGHPIGERRPARCDNRQSAAEADAHHAYVSIRGESRVGREPHGGLLDGVGNGRCDFEPRQLGDVGSDHRETAGRQLTRETNQSRLVDP